MTIPLGCPISTINGARLDNLGPSEIMALLDLRVHGFRDLVARHQFNCDQSHFGQIAEVVETLNATMRKMRGKPFFMPNYPWSSSVDRVLTGEHLKNARDICHQMAIHWEGKQSNMAAAARDALIAMIGVDDASSS